MFILNELFFWKILMQLNKIVKKRDTYYNIPNVK